METVRRTRTQRLAVVVAALSVLASVTYAADPTTLTNGVALTGLSGAAGSETLYRFDVPAGVDTLSIKTSGGTGDVDLYVKKDALPTTTSYDYRPYKVGNEEAVDVNKPAAGAWYILLRGYAGYSNVTLLAAYSVSNSTKELTNGVPVTGIGAAANAELYYSIEIPADATKLEIAMSGGTGDADLYVKKDALPTLTSYDYRPFQTGNNESVNVDSPNAGTWYIMIRGYQDFAGVTLLASFAGGSGGGTGNVLQNGVAVTDLSGVATSEKLFRFDLPAGQKSVEIKMSGGTGDADMYVKLRDPPTTTSYDYRPFQTGNEETVTVDAPSAGTWYVLVRGYADYAGVSLKATWGSVTALKDGVAVPNLSGAANSEMFFSIDVPTGTSSLKFVTAGGTGNADLYVRKGAMPTTAVSDYRSLGAGNSETITVTSPGAGTWYVLLKGVKAYSGLSLTATLTGVTALQNNVAVPNLSGALDSETFFSIAVPSGQTNIEFLMSGGTGNADLYIKQGAKPTTSLWDYRLNTAGNSESINISSDMLTGTWYLMIKGAKAYDGVSLKAHYSATEAVVTPLTNGVPVNNLAGYPGTQLFYRIDVPAGQAKFEIRISGGTGDADLYVRKGNKPSAAVYDYKPDLQDNDEAVTINNPTAGTWYIMVRGHTAFAGVTLLATYGGTAPDTVTTLQNGVPVNGITGAADSEKFYKIVVPAGQAKLDIVMTGAAGSTGDADLYVKKGAKPTATSYDFRPYLSGSNESVSIDTPDAATWYIMVRGYSAYTGVSLKATYTPLPEAVVTLTNGVPLPGQAGASGSEKFYKIDVPSGQHLLTIATSGGSGDVDLYVKKGSKPSVSSYDYRPYLIGNDEQVDVTNPAAATWYILLRGYQAYSGVTVEATYGTGTTPPPGTGNVFNTDPNCVALWRMEPGALTTDSVGANTLTNVNVTANTTSYEEGAGAAEFDLVAGVWDTRNWLSIADDNLTRGFPGKSATSNKRFTLCFWIQFTSIPTGENEWSIFTKANSMIPENSYSVRFIPGGKITLSIGSGSNSRLDYGTACKVGTWYHVAVTFDDATHTGAINVWDGLAGAMLGTEAKRTTFPSMPLTRDAVVLGSVDQVWYQCLAGLLDEVVVFNDVLSTQDIAKIRAGNYGRTH